MTEFARTPPTLQRLYRSIDLAPLPRHEVIAQSLDAWRKARGTHVSPGPLQVGKEQSSAVLENSLVAEQIPASDDFRLRSIGQHFRKQTGFPEGSRSLADMGNPRTAVRLRHLFRFTIKQGEPVAACFTDSDHEFEVLAAPLELDNGRVGIWCTMAATALEHHGAV